MTLLTVFSDSFTGEQEGIIISGALDGLDVKLFIEDLNDAQAEDCPLTLRVVAWRQTPNISVGIVSYKVDGKEILGSITVYQNHARSERPGIWFPM